MSTPWMIPDPEFLAAAAVQARAIGVPVLRYGRVRSVIGLVVEVTHLDAALGEFCFLHVGEGPARRRVAAEVVGVRGETTLVMPLESTAGLRAGALAEKSARPLTIAVGDALLGRVLDADGSPIDGLGPVAAGDRAPVHRDPPAPMTRRMISDQLLTGVRAIDAFTPLGQGQRIGIFAGSGVGKSTLLGMIARETSADVNVIALIGERSREVQEFIIDNLGADGLARSVVVVVTGDQAAMRRIKGAYAACAIAEFFRDRGQHVLLMMDSITRFAMAQREVGLAVGEPPTTRGYTPSVFARLPQLLERAGPGSDGTITGIYTVLVDGDDLNEPVGDAVRGILDGHIVLSRELANAGHYPAIDVLGSVSRVERRVAAEPDLSVVGDARRLLAAYRRSEDVIRIGAYEPGSDPETDAAIAARPGLNAFLQQSIREPPRMDPFDALKHALIPAANTPVTRRPAGT